MKFCVSSTRSVGCTFLDWSIHFLSRQSYFYHVISKTWIPLSQNPLSKINAHGHKKNHPSGADLNLKFINSFDNISKGDLFSVYPFKMHVDNMCNKLGYQLSDMQTPDIWKKINQEMDLDYQKIFNDCHAHDTKIIFLGSNPDVCLYGSKIRSLDRMFTKPVPAKSTDELTEEYQNLFFKSSIDSWKELGLTEIWDIRERMALDIRPFDIGPDPVLRLPHLHIDSRDWWIRGPKVIQKIFKFLSLTLDQERMQQWLPIYYQWQQIQTDALEFVYYIDHIINAIVNNIYFEIDLTFEEETVVQHCLLYKHNLNLKTWQLTKFPNNTQDLYKLLEPNIHTV
jgi:hypothetical protein